MKLPRYSSSKRGRSAALLLTSIMLIAAVATSYAAYRTMRPIAVGPYGYISQSNLYGEIYAHKGVDFPAALDTDVFAIADGVVRQVEESFDDGCDTCPAFGNFILVRHTKQHYDRTTGQAAYVYSLYAHLSKSGAFVNPGDNVVAGQVIGDVDDTGNSFGHHLHLQLMIDPNLNQTLVYPLTWTEAHSRNPELWINPYPNTAAMIGKVTDTGGTPVPNLQVVGMKKQQAWAFGWSTTYSSPALNSDDIFVENFATTDVTPGTYSLVAKQWNGQQWVDYKQLGTHTFTVGKITYVGLYPNYLPDVRAIGGWDAKIVIHNPSGSRTAQVVTTFFEGSAGLVSFQRTDLIGPRRTLTVSPPGGLLGSALVVGSEPLAVVVESTHAGNTIATAYSGITAPSTTAYQPTVYNSSTNRTVLTAHNAGISPTPMTARVTYYSTTGASYGPYTYPLELHANWQDEAPPPGLDEGGAVLMAPESLAVAGRVEWYTNDVRTRASSYSGATTGRTQLYAPSIYRTKFDATTWNILSGVRLQNVTANTVSVTLNFTSRSDSSAACLISRVFQDTIPRLSSHGYNTRSGGYRNGVFDANLFLPLENNGACLDWSGALAVTANSGQVAGTVNTVWIGGDRAGTYSMLGPEDAKVNVALAKQMYTSGGKRSAINVMNTSSTPVNIEVKYYNSLDGTLRYSTPPVTLQANQAIGYNTNTLSGFPSGFEGSAVVSTLTGPPGLIAIGNLIYTTSDPGGDRAAVYEGLGF